MIAEFLHKPYPIILDKWKLIGIVSLFIAFFLSVFQPFGLQFVEMNNKTAVLMGYGGVTFLILLLDLFLVPVVFKKNFREENWTIGKQMLWLLFVVFTISIGNYGYSIIFFNLQRIGLYGLLIFGLFTLSVALIPIVVITFIAQNVHLKRNLQLSARMNEGINEKTSDTQADKIITINSGVQQFTFPLDNILFLESEGNYVQVNYLESEQVKTRLIRNTMKNISAEIHEKELFKCHRAFMINLTNIEKVQGNSHGISVELKHTSQIVPVSRTNTKAFTELMNSVKA